MSKTQRPKRLFILILGAIFILGLFLGYTVYLQRPSVVPPTGDTFMERLPWNLRCVDVETSSEVGPTWNGITIGRTHWLMVTIRAGGIGIWDRYRGNIEYERHYEHACYQNGKIVAFQTSCNLPAEYLTEWIDLLGPPDVVTWGTYIGSRSVIWAEQGIMVVTEYISTTTIDSVVAYYVFYFPPIAEDDLEESWLINTLPDSQLELSDFIGHEPTPEELEQLEPEEGWLPPEILEYLEQEDPWGISTMPQD